MVNRYEEFQELAGIDTNPQKVNNAGFINPATPKKIDRQL